MTDNVPAQAILSDPSRTCSLEDLVGLTVAGQKYQAKVSVTPETIPRAPVSLGGWRQKTSGPPSLDEFRRRTKACRDTHTYAYYSFADDKKTKITRQGTRVLYGALNHWYDMVRKGAPVEDFCVYNDDLRVVCTKEVFFRHFARIAEDYAVLEAPKARSEGKVPRTAEEVLQGMFDNSITFENFNNSPSHKERYEGEIANQRKYREIKMAEEARKPKKEVRAKLDVNFKDLNDLAKKIGSQLRSNGGRSGEDKKARWVKEKIDLKGQLSRILSDPLQSESVVDVTSFGTKVGDTKGRIISRSAAARQHKLGVNLGKFPIVSGDLGSYERAVSYLGREYGHYVDLMRSAM